MKYLHKIVLSLGFLFSGSYGYVLEDNTEAATLKLCRKTAQELFKSDSLRSDYIEQILTLQSPKKDTRDYLWEAFTIANP